MGKHKARFGDHYSYHMGPTMEGSKREILDHIRETLKLRMRRTPRLKTWVDNDRTVWVWESSEFRKDDTGVMAICTIERKGREQ